MRDVGSWMRRRLSSGAPAGAAATGGSDSGPDGDDAAEGTSRAPATRSASPELIGEPSLPGGDGRRRARRVRARRCHFTAGGTETRLACRIVVGATLFVQLDGDGEDGADDCNAIRRSGVVRDAAPLARLSKITSRKTVAGLVLFHFKRGTAATAATAKPGSVSASASSRSFSRKSIRASASRLCARYKYLISRPPPPPPPRPGWIGRGVAVAATRRGRDGGKPGANAPPSKPSRAPPPLKPTRAPPPPSTAPGRNAGAAGVGEGEAGRRRRRRRRANRHSLRSRPAFSLFNVPFKITTRAWSPST